MQRRWAESTVRLVVAAGVVYTVLVVCLTTYLLTSQDTSLRPFSPRQPSSTQAPTWSSEGVRGVRAAAARQIPIGPALAYGVMVYQRKGHSVEQVYEQFRRMFEALYVARNTYAVHVDVKSDKELHERIARLLGGRKNVRQIDPVSVSWAGITVVERTLALMQAALELDEENSACADAEYPAQPCAKRSASVGSGSAGRGGAEGGGEAAEGGWRYFVNVGHEDYPLASQEAASSWLADVPDGTNFIKCWQLTGHDFFGQWEHHEKRVEQVFVDDFMGMTEDSGYRRKAPDPELVPFKFYKSLQQTVLSRETVKFAVRSAAARRLLVFMSTSQAPDELYFPTLVQLEPSLAQKATCNDTRHFSYWIRPGGSWHPEYLTLDHLPVLLNATEFYGRKVDTTHDSGPLLDVLDARRRGEPLEASLPILAEWLDSRPPLTLDEHESPSAGVLAAVLQSQKRPFGGWNVTTALHALETRRKVYRYQSVATFAKRIREYRARRQSALDAEAAAAAANGATAPEKAAAAANLAAAAPEQAELAAKLRAAVARIGPGAVANPVERKEISLR